MVTELLARMNEKYGSAGIVKNWRKAELSFLHVALCVDLLYNPT